MKKKTNMIALTDENFTHHVLESTQPVLVKFGTNWSGSCHIMMSIIEGLAVKFSGKIKFCKLDVDRFPETTEMFDIRTIPTVLFFNHGRVAEQTTGVVSKNEVEDKLKTLLRQ
ncbi:MAG: thioredoxin family protein, partial [bacterium]